MSAIVVLTPLVAAAWPVVGAAAVGALTSLGYSRAGPAKRRSNEPCSVTVEVENSRVFAEGPRLAKEPVFILLTIATAALCLWAWRLCRA